MQTSSKQNADSDEQERLHTWAALLAHWTAAAQAAAALPKDDPEAGRWRASIVPMVTLQGLCLVLAELPRLDPPERAVGSDRAEVILAEQSAALAAAWRGQPMPEGLFELLADARTATEAAAHLGHLFLVSETSTPFTMPDLASLFESDVADASMILAAPPGSTLGPGTPALFITPDASAITIDGLVRQEPVRPPVQVYLPAVEGDTNTSRQPLVAPLFGEVHPGRPLLRVIRSSSSSI